MKLEAIYAGKIRLLQPEGQSTGIYKDPIESAEVGPEGIVGDQQADRRVHGGPEKALHQFAQESYTRIAERFPELREQARPGAMGENLSCAGLHERNVCIGDVFAIGAVRVQVAQPRLPCWKINRKFGVDALAGFIVEQRLNGWYYRVLEGGVLRVGDSVELLERPNPEVTVDCFLSVTTAQRPEPASLRLLRDAQGLTDDWRRRLHKRLHALAGPG